MTEHFKEDSTKQSTLLTILFTILSCVIWTTILVFIFQIPVKTWTEEKALPFINQLFLPKSTKDSFPKIPTWNIDVSKEDTETKISRYPRNLREIALDTITQYDYPLFFFPVSQNKRLPMDYPTVKAQLPLATIGEVRVAEIIVGPLIELMNAAREAGYGPYLRSGFRSINDQYTAYSKYVTEATVSGIELSEAREYVNQYSALPGYSEHHLGLAVDILDYTFYDWVVARDNYDKRLYLWFRLHAHEFGFVVSYPTGVDKTLSKTGSGYPFAEPWHLRFVGKDLAFWLFDNGYLDPQENITVNSVLLEINSVLHNADPIQQ